MSTELADGGPGVVGAGLVDSGGLDAHLNEDEGSSGPVNPRERHSLTLDQRRALRRWANSQTTRPSHKACIEWFQQQYNHTISQSTVSHSLSPKYARLDGDPQLSGSRLRFGNWPDVEKLVLLWHQGMVSAGRHPTNEELAEKAKNIFQQLPRYKDEQPPEFSPGWIHRFKKRYGLLMKRPRRHGSLAGDLAENIPYLKDAIPRFMNVSGETSPAAIRDTVQRVVGIEPSLITCARVRDEIIHGLEHPQGPAPGQHPPNGHISIDGILYPTEEDPETLLNNALRQAQEAEANAEAEAAVARQERELRDMSEMKPDYHPSYAQQAAAGALANAGTPLRNSMGVGVGVGGGPNGAVTQAHFTPTPGPPPRPSTGPQPGEDLTLTPIQSEGPTSVIERPVRCPFCVNQRMLRTIKEAVEHLSTHVVV